MAQNVELYTAQEQKYLQDILKLLGIKYTSKAGEGVISSIIYNFECNMTELNAIAGMMKANYEKITGR